MALLADVAAGKQSKINAEFSHPLSINVISRASGKPAIARAAHMLVGGGAGLKSSFSIETNEMNSIIEGTVILHWKLHE